MSCAASWASARREPLTQVCTSSTADRDNGEVTSTSPRAALRLLTMRLSSTSPLTFPEGVGVVTLALAACAIEVVLFFVRQAETPVEMAPAFELVVTMTFALFASAPRSAVTLCVLATLASLANGSALVTLLAFAVSLGLTVRTGTVGMVVVACASFALANAALLWEIGPNSSEGANPAMSIPIAVAAVMVGLLVRRSHEREHMLDAEVQAAIAREENVAREERLRIAADLHDVVGHDLTIIALHAALLRPDRSPVVQAEARRAITDASRRAMSDLRRVMGQAEPLDDRSPGIETLNAAVADAIPTLRSAGFSVDVVETCTSDRIPRMVDQALARALRESVTNILKYARHDSVSISCWNDETSVSLSIVSGIPASQRTPVAGSGGQGLTRLSERARALGGSYDAGRYGDTWQVHASFPLGLDL